MAAWRECEDCHAYLVRIPDGTFPIRAVCWTCRVQRGEDPATPRWPCPVCGSQASTDPSHRYCGRCGREET